MPAPLLVTIATQRSGTKFLGGCLNAGTLVRSVHECFQPGEPRRLFPRFLHAWFAAHPEFDFRGSHMQQLLRAFLRHLAEEGDRPVLHLDVMYNNLGGFAGAWAWPPPGGDSPLAAALRAGEARILHLVRDSVAECHGSTIIAERRGWHRRHALGDPEASLRLAADLRRAERDMRAILLARDFVRRRFGRYPHVIELRYPDFIDGVGIAAPVRDSIARLLGLSPTEAAALCGPCDLQPTAPDKAVVIENWDALVALEARLRQDIGCA